MVSFIETIEDDHLVELLTGAIDGNGAFRRFKDVSYDYPEEWGWWWPVELTPSESCSN